MAPSQLCILVDILARLPAGGAGQSSLQHASVQLAQVTTITRHAVWQHTDAALHPKSAACDLSIKLMAV